MPFPSPIRNWFLRVSGNGKEEEARCEVEIYTEQGGWKECGSKKKLQVHHIEPEAEVRERGGDPDGVMGLVVCAWHHIFGRSDVLGEQGGSFHPDMGQAAIDYRKGDKDAYKKAARLHREKAKRGERFVSGDYGTDQYYTDKAMSEGTEYVITHDDPRPVVKHRDEKRNKIKWNKKTGRWEE